MSIFKLKRLHQCEKCPWKVSTNPLDIPNGYDVKKHKKLKETIADPDNQDYFPKEIKIMACHETEDSHCIGWLHNQLGSGNNIALRISMMNCENISHIKIVGKQHKSFNETLPKTNK